MRSSASSMADMQAYIEEQKTILEGLDLCFECHDDPNEFNRLFVTLPGTNGVQSTFDPAVSSLGPANFWWSTLRHGDRIVGINAQRCFVVDDFVEAFELYSAFFDRVPVVDWKPLGIATPLKIPRLSGRVVLGGSMWVADEFRGKQLYYAYSQLVQTLSLRHFRASYNVALYRNEPKYVKLARAGGFPHVRPLMCGPYPGSEMAHRDFLLAWRSRAESLRMIRDKVRKPRADSAHRRFWLRDLLPLRGRLGAYIAELRP